MTDEFKDELTQIPPEAGGNHPPSPDQTSNEKPDTITRQALMIQALLETTGYPLNLIYYHFERFKDRLSNHEQMNSEITLDYAEGLLSDMKSDSFLEWAVFMADEDEVELLKEIKCPTN